jgi:hypothetical protein
MPAGHSRRPARERETPGSGSVCIETQSCCKIAKRSQIPQHDFCMVYISNLQKNGAQAYKSRISEVRPGTRLFVCFGSKLKKLKKIMLKKLIVRV